MSVGPFIFILDLDGTIIGDCLYQVLINNIDNILKQNLLKTNYKNMLSDCYSDKMKLLRPYFIYFMKHITQYNPLSQFYIYTASEKSWANKEVGFIEKTNNVKFNRPIFTRDDCIVDSYGMYKKSVEKILPKILKNNKGIKINKKNILIIDNNKVFIDYFSNIIICPSYEYIKFCDLSQKFDNDILNNLKLKELFDELANSNKICNLQNIDENEEALEQRHKWYYKKYKKINKYNKKYKKDIFWKRLADGIIGNKLLTFDKMSVANLHKQSCTKIS